MDNQNQFPKSDSDLPLNKPDGSNDTFTDKSISQQAQTIQSIKADKTPVQTVKIVAGVLFFLGLYFVFQSLPILVSMVSESSLIPLNMLRSGVPSIFQFVIGVLSSITGILLIRRSKGARILVILTAISMFVAEIFLIFQGGFPFFHVNSLFNEILPFRNWLISLSLVTFLCYFLIRSVTSKEVRMLFAKHQQIVAAKAQLISNASIQTPKQITLTEQEESEDSRIRYNLKIIGFTGIVFGFIVLLFFAYGLAFRLSLPPLNYGLTPSLLPQVRQLVFLITSGCLLIAGIGLSRYKQWGQLMFKIAGIVIAVPLGMDTGYMLCGLPFVASLPLGIIFFGLLELVIPFTLFLIGLIFVIRYLGKEKVKKVCS